MTQQTSISQSPLAEWWQSNRFSVNEACLKASSSVAGAASKKRLLADAVDGSLSIDDRRLRAVVGCLIAGPGNALEAIQQHRAWAKNRGTA